MLFNEPKLLKFSGDAARRRICLRFSALQRAEIAEIMLVDYVAYAAVVRRFSALQRAEIAEMPLRASQAKPPYCVSVLFNEPKLLKYDLPDPLPPPADWFQCSSTSRNC